MSPPLADAVAGAGAPAATSRGGHTADIPQVPSWAHALMNGQRPVQLSTGSAYHCELRTGPNASLVSISLERAAVLSPADFEAAAGDMINHAFQALGASPTPRPVRVWNFVPGIDDPMSQGLDRYQLFNIARHRALSSILGAAAVSGGGLPAASCVGHDGDALIIHALGAAHPGIPIENPRQVPAFAYSTRYGPRPPCFSRATLATFGRASLLLLAGTASVVGEESVHGDDRAAQLAETIRNLESLLAPAQRRIHRDPWSGITSARIYYRRHEDRDWFAEHIPSALRAAPTVEWVRADICRAELLVEIEAVADLSAG